MIANLSQEEKFDLARAMAKLGYGYEDIANKRRISYEIAWTIVFGTTPLWKRETAEPSRETKSASAVPCLCAHASVSKKAWRSRTKMKQARENP